jgi:hypothetical protein
MKSLRRKTLVTVETERQLFIAQHNVRRFLCEACGEQIDLIISREQDSQGRANLHHVVLEGVGTLLSPSSSNEEEDTNASEE